jgi:YfiH family protein
LRNDFVFVDGKVPYYESRLFKKNGIKHAFFTRLGGVSEGGFGSLNFAVGNGEIKDSEENVFENHRIAAEVFGLDVTDICRSVQTHTTVVEVVGNSDRGRGLTTEKFDRGVDGLVTKEKNLLLSIRVADCVPVLLCDPDSEICAAVHAGWRGTVGGITKNAVEKMVSLGAKRENILAAIGPCIGKCCYEVGRELYEEFLSVSSEYSEFFEPRGEKFMLDLNLANIKILSEAGILPENISTADLCTKCNEAHFFSHRRQGAVRGTLSAMIEV